MDSSTELPHAECKASRGPQRAAFVIAAALVPGKFKQNLVMQSIPGALLFTLEASPIWGPLIIRVRAHAPTDAQD